MQETRTVLSKRLRSIASSVTTAVLLSAARTANAVQTGLDETAAKAQLNTSQRDLPVMIGSIIQSLLGLVGVIFLVLTIYAGFLWMTAQGNEEQISKAKKILSGAVIGMVLVFASYGITRFVVFAVLQGTGAPGAPR